MSIQFMADNDTINWNQKTITIRDNIKLLHITINHYPEYISIYNNSNSKSKSKTSLEKFYNWGKVIEYWHKNINEYNQKFNIEFDKFTIYVDYSLAPFYINNDNIFIGIFIVNTKLIKSIHEKDKNIKINNYSFLSRIEPYKYKKEINSNKYNLFYGILNNKNDNNKNSNNENEKNLKNKEFMVYTNLDTKINIPLKYILQNSMNYLPKLEINRIKMISRNLLNP